MRTNISFGLSRRRRNPCKVRNVRSLADAMDFYHRTGVFDARVSDVESFDLTSDGTGDFIRNVDTSLLECEGRCEDLLVAAATQMHSKSKKESQVTNITPPSGGGNGPGSSGADAD